MAEGAHLSALADLSSSCTVRPRRDEDLPALADLLLAQQPGSRYPHRDPLPMPPEDFLRRPGELAAFVAEVDGRLIGHVALLAVREPGPGAAGCVERAWEHGHGLPWTRLAALAAFVTDPEVRGLGVGRRLHDRAVADADDRGLAPCLDVLPLHARAQALYRRWGWVEAGRVRPPWLADDVEDVLAMVLPRERA